MLKELKSLALHPTHNPVSAPAEKQTYTIIEKQTQDVHLHIKFSIIYIRKPKNQRVSRNQIDLRLSDGAWHDLKYLLEILHSWDSGLPSDCGRQPRPIDYYQN